MIKRITLILLVFLSVKSLAQFGPQQIITTNVGTARYVSAADINGDDNIDVVTASEGDDTLAWYENIDGLGTFGPKQIITETLNNPRYIITADLDGDGDMDVLSMSGSNDLIVWYKNLDGQGTFSTANLISDQADLPKSVIAADIDGDGDLDVLSASRNDNKVAWYENTDGLGTFGTEQIISSSALTVFSVFAADLDGDNDLDVIVTSGGNKRLYWYENLDGLGTFSPGNIIVETTGFGGFVSVFSIDIDGDNDMDVLSAEFGGGRLAWYENTDGQGTFGPQQIITDEIDTPDMIIAIDLDNDNDNDVLSLSDGGGSVVWFENTDGLGNFGSQQIITTNVSFPKSVFAADLDNDTDNDVLSASAGDNKIAWYENLTILGLEDNTLVNLTLYPNPTQNILYINNSNSILIKEIVVYDIRGKVLIEKSNDFTQIDISSLASSLLFIKIVTKEGLIIKKIIKE